VKKKVKLSNTLSGKQKVKIRGSDFWEKGLQKWPRKLEKEGDGKEKRLGMLC